MIPRMITVHCSANSNGSRITGEDIKRFHMAKPPEGRGWAECGYHIVIESDGGVFRGRPDNVTGAHVAGHNNGNLGVCLIGLNKFSRDQFESLRWIITGWQKSYGITDDKIFMHYQWDSAQAQGKSCPNINYISFIGWLRTGDESFIEANLLS